MVFYLGVWQHATGRNVWGAPLETQRAETATTDTHPALVHGSLVIYIIQYDEGSQAIYRANTVQCLALLVLKLLF